VIGVSALLFFASAALTVVWSASMSSMGAMPMPGGWTMSMLWMRMPGQTWPGAAASFLGMWAVMMAAMMLPSLTPTLWRYRRSLGAAGASRLRSGALASMIALGYFLVWILPGVIVFPLGMALAVVAMARPAVATIVPIAIGIVVIGAGALQFSAWKARHLDCCREGLGRGRPLPPDARSAWRDGVRLGLHCICSCAGPLAVLLVVGVMDLGIMAIVTTVITLERVLPTGERVSGVIGAVGIAAGVVLVVQGVGIHAVSASLIAAASLGGAVLRPIPPKMAQSDVKTNRMTLL
jgi:predicted metal-binding membrane protein